MYKTLSTSSNALQTIAKTHRFSLTVDRNTKKTDNRIIKEKEVNKITHRRIYM